MFAVESEGPARTLICKSLVGGDISQGPSVEDALSTNDLSAILTESTGTLVEEIEQGGEEPELALPEETTAIDAQ